MKRTLPKYRLAEIKKMLPFKTYREIAEVMGCSFTVVSYWSRKLGLHKTRPRGHFKTAESVVKENWATHAAKEIAEMVGCSQANIIHIKNRLGLTRTKEQEADIQKRRYEKQRATQKENHERDRRRMMFGLEPINKCFLTIAPRHILQVGYNLHRKYKYEYTDDPYVMSRNGHKIVSRKCGEEYYTKKYKIRFID